MRYERDGWYAAAATISCHVFVMYVHEQVSPKVSCEVGCPVVFMSRHHRSGDLLKSV